MWSLNSRCDEFYVASRLFFKLALDPSRETLLHFLEQIRRAYPAMSRFHRAEDGSVVLEEEPQGDRHGDRYVKIEPGALKFGYYHAGSLETVERFADHVLAQAPYDLSLSDLDYDYMEVAYCFDLEYRGNHDELIADTLFADHPLMHALGEHRHVVDCQPFFGIGLSEDCSTQAYLEVKSRTTTHEMRQGEYIPQPLSVYFTVRRYWGFGGSSDLATVHRELLTAGEAIVQHRVLPTVVQPLVEAIATRR
ncbi:MAG: hypothetical protein JNG88_06885 [Phycisphaerales bacterium]|nr:hypothetical protein [Phycisphaerales bacterium]